MLVVEFIINDSSSCDRMLKSSSSAAVVGSIFKLVVVAENGCHLGSSLVGDTLGNGLNFAEIVCARMRFITVV